MASLNHTRRERLALVFFFLAAACGPLLGRFSATGLARGVGSAAVILAMPCVMYLTGVLLRGTSATEKRRLSAGFFGLYGAQKLLTFYAAFAALTQPEFSILKADEFSWPYLVLGAVLLFAAQAEDRHWNLARTLVLTFLVCTLGLYVKYVGSYLALSYLLTFGPLVLLGLWEPESLRRRVLESCFATVCALVLCAGVLGACMLRPESFWAIRSFFLGSCGYGKVPARVVHLLGGGVRIAHDILIYLVANGLIRLFPDRRIPYFSAFGKRWYAAWFWYAPGLTLIELLALEKLSAMGTTGMVLAAALVLVLLFLAGTGWARYPAELLLNWHSTLEHRPRRIAPGASFLKRHRGGIFYVFAYTCAFAIAAMGIAYSLVAANKSLVWNVDGLQQQYTSLLYFRNYVFDAIAASKEAGQLILPQFTFTGGQGMAVLDVIRKDPFVFFALLTDETHMEAMFAFLVFFRMWVAGLLFSALLWEMDRKGNSQRICGALVYVFSGYTICVMVRQTSFLHTCLVNLPLILWGTERYLRRGKGGLFLFAIFLGSFNGYYATWMNSLMMAVWVLIRLLDEYGLDLKTIFGKILKLLGIYLWALCLAMVVFLPAVVTLANSSRGESAGYSGSLLYYNPSYYQTLFTSLASGYKPVAYWTINGIAAIGLLSAVLLFLKKERRLLALKAGVLVGFAGLCIPLAGKVMNGFGYVSNRWCYGFALVLGLTAATMLPYFFSLTVRDKRVLVGVTVVYSAIVLAGNGNDDIRRFYGLAMVMATLLVALALETLNWNLRQKQAVLSLTVCLSLIGSLAFSLLPGFENYLSLCLDAGTVESTLENSPAAVASELEDDSFYRIEQPQLRSNQATALNYYGTTAYFSIVSAEMSEYYNSFTLPGMVQTYDLQGLDNRAGLEALAGVKYYLGREGKTGKVPYGFEKVNEISKNDTNYVVYENQNYLSGGYAYTGVMKRSDYDALSPLERQQAILQYAVVEDDAEVALASGTPVTDITRSEVKVKKANGVTIDFDAKTITAEAPSGGKESSVVLKFKSLPESETLLSIDGLVYTDEDSSDVLHLRCRAQEENCTTYVHGNNHTYYFDREGVSYNLGYSEDGLTTCELFFNAACELRFDDIAVYSLPVSRFQQDIDALKTTLLENVEQVGDTFSGTISCQEDCILSTVVPYSKGWSIYVDGEEAELLQVNIMYCGTVLTPGEHTVELRYVTPGIKAGGAISAVAFAALVAYGVVKGLRKKKR